MKPLPVVGPSLVAAVSLLALVVSRMRHEEERKRLAALKAAHAVLERHSAALETMVARLQRDVSKVEREKDEFLATLSHELRSPLNTILGWVGLLRLEGRDPLQQAHALDVIERSARAEVRLVADLLDMARLVTGRMALTHEPVFLPTVVREAVNGVSDAAATKGIALHVESPDAVQVIGDRTRLRQVVAHLLANAVKFTEPGGSVSVRVGVEASDAIIQVTDTGVGLTPAMLPRVFDRFRQADSGLTRTHGGLGIGLTIVRHLVALHGGTVEVASPGLHRGSTFTLRLPRGAGP